MPPSLLWRISIDTPPEAEDAVASLLASATSAAASIYTDQQTGLSRVSVYLAHRPPRPALLRAELRAGLDHMRQCGFRTGPARIRFTPMKSENWAESWKRHFPPLLIEGRLLLKPGWNRRRPRPGQVAVVLDPGLSFGTGHHPTTSFCLAQIVRHTQAQPHASMLDIGCGSGILAIAAARLGCRPVEAFDFDPVAVRIARKNAIRNRVRHRVRIALRDVARLPARGGRRFDLVCANLTHDLLQRHAGRIQARVRPGGRLVLAGILHSQFAPVRRCYETLGFRLVTSLRVDEWRSGAFELPA